MDNLKHEHFLFFFFNIKETFILNFYVDLIALVTKQNFYYDI